MYQTTAKGLAALGRNGDSMLMHVNPNEVAALSKILGPVSTNPKTGLPEAYNWASLLGSVAGGIGSFGVGAALSPIIGEAFEDGIMKDIMSKAVPALTGAGIGAAIGGATGGKAGAMGGGLQGLLSGGLGAYASEDMLGSQPKAYAPAAQEELPSTPFKDTENYQRMGDTGAPSQYGAIEKGLFKGPDILQQEAPDYAEKVNTMRETASTAEKPGFFDNLGTLGKKAFTSEGFKQYEDYIPYLFQAGMIGNAVTSEQQDKDVAQQTQENIARYNALRKRQAEDLARSTYSYADGGPVVMQSQGPLPIKVTIPEPLVQKVKDSGGLASFMQGRQHSPTFATGGYVNTQPFNPQEFYPQSRIATAQPYAAAGNTGVVNTLAHGASFAEGGLIDGEGDGMSDDIDANIEGHERVRVADGEYVVPKHIAEMLGVDRLDELLRRVRQAAHGKEEQVREGAGLKAAKQELGLA
jgi:hypothetical protein